MMAKGRTPDFLSNRKKVTEKITAQDSAKLGLKSVRISGFTKYLLFAHVRVPTAWCGLGGEML